MKTLLFIILFIPTIVYSQDRKTTFGIQIGYSSSWTSEKSEVTNTTTKQMSDIPSILLGGLVNYKISPIFSVQCEAVYAKKGFTRDINYSDNSNAFSQTQEFSINRIDVPVLVKLNFTKSKLLYFTTGAAPSFVLSSKYVIDVSQTKPTVFSETHTSDPIPDLNSFDIPLVFSFGFERPVGKTFLGLQLRYNKGMIDYFESSVNRTSKISSFNLIGGIRF